MKMRWAIALLALAGLSTAGARAAGFGFTVSSATVVNNDANANGKADVGETFTVTGAAFSSYLSSGANTPAINENDLNRYSANITGTVASVTGDDVRYTGTFQIIYTGPAYPAGVAIESGSADFIARYDANGVAVLRGVLRANPGVEAAVSGDVNFKDTDFADFNPGRFFGVYTPTPGNPGTGSLVASVNAGNEGFAASLHNASLVNNDANSNGVADVGETFSLTSSIAAYYPQNANALLPLNDNDLTRYQVVMNGTVVSVVGRTVDYTGTYAIRYTGPAYPGGVDIETGTFMLNARFNDLGTGAAKLSGELVATPGVPAAIANDVNFKNSDFAIFNPARFNGTYEPSAPGAGSGVVSGSLSGGVLGFSATVGAGTIVNGDENNNGVADENETFTATGPLSAYMAVGAPPLLDKDLNRYTLNLSGIASSVVGNVVIYTGNFNIRYNGPALNAVVEDGTFSIVATFAADGTATLSGTLRAEPGASYGNAPFENTDYAPFNPAVFTGFYRSAGATGTFFGNITSGAMVQSLTSRKVGANIQGSPTAATTSADARRALVVSGSTLFVIDPATGFDAPGWEGGKALDGKVSGSGRPVVLGDQVFVGTDTGMLYRFDLISGNLLNSGRPGGVGSRILTSPAPVKSSPVDQVVVAISDLNGSAASAVVRLAANDFNTATAGPQVLSANTLTVSSPAVPLNGNVYVGSNAGLFILDYTTLTIKAQTSDPVLTSPLVANGLVWLATGNAAALRALNANNLNDIEALVGYNLKSELQLSAFYDSTNGYVYAGTYDGRVHAFDANGQHEGLVLPGLFNPENTGNSLAMPVAANRLMFRATENKQILFGLPLTGDAQGAVDLVSPVRGAMAATGQMPGADFVIGSSDDGFIHTMSLPGVEVANVPGPVVLVNVPMDQQINQGITTNSTSPSGDAIYIPGNFDEMLSFESDAGGGFARVSIAGGSWYYGPYVDFNLMGIPGVDISKAGTTIEFDARYFQPTDNSNRYADAPIFLRVYSYTNNNTTLTGYRDYGIVYGTQAPWSNPAFPDWSHVVVNANDPAATTTNTSGTLLFDPTKVTRMRMYGTDWYSPANAFKAFIDVKNFQVIQQP